MKKPTVFPRTVKRPGDFSIEFSVQLRANPFSSAIYIAAQQGVRAITIQNIATQTKCSIGTIGRWKIDDYVEHVVDFCFDPLIMLFEGPRLLIALKPAFINEQIDLMLELDRLVAPQVMQAKALATTIGARKPAADGKQSMLDRFRHARAEEGSYNMATYRSLRQ